jgi:processive 1,2-diacylglycerol beta-glucosyltransferase
MERVLILSASTGNGHTSAANALKEELEARGHVAQVLDCMDHVMPMFKRWFKGGYEMLVKESPWIWGHLYRTSDRPLFNYWVQTMLDKRCSYPIDEVIREFKPTWFLCTHSVVQPRLPKLRKELQAPVAVVVTDLYPHRMWLRGSPDYYFVPTEESEKVLISRMPQIEGNTTVTGIPVNVAFANAPSKAEAREKLGMDPNKPSVLITSGGIGGGPFGEVVAMLSQQDIFLNVVAGRSKEALRELTERFGNTPNVKLHGHVDQPTMASFMAASDLMVGKSGGLTTFEALAVGVPFLVYLPFLIPGQEEDNARFLEQIGASMVATDINDLEVKSKALLSQPEKLEAMSKCAKAHGKPEAKKMIIDTLLSLDRQALLARKDNTLVGTS